MIYQPNAPWLQRLLTRAFDMQGKTPTNLEANVRAVAALIDLTDHQYKYGALTSSWGASDEVAGGVGATGVILQAQTGAAESKKIIRITNMQFWSMSAGAAFSVCARVYQNVVPLLGSQVAIDPGPRDSRLQGTRSVMQTIGGVFAAMVLPTPAPGDDNWIRYAAGVQAGSTEGSPAPRFDPGITLRASDALVLVTSRSGMNLAYNIEWDERDCNDTELTTG